MIEKQESYQEHDWKTEEKSRSLASPPFTPDSPWEPNEHEIDISKMRHMEVTGYDRKETKSHIDEFPSTKASREADVCGEAGSTSKTCFVIQLLTDADKALGKPPQAFNPEANGNVTLGLPQIKEHTASKPRKKRRPQSLNLGMPGEYRKGGSDSSGDENVGSGSGDSPGNTSEASLQKVKEDPGSGKDESVRVNKKSKQGDQSVSEGREANRQTAEGGKKIVSLVGSTDIDLSSVNGPGKVEHESSLTAVKSDYVTKVRGKVIIDNKELAEVKLRQVRTHERKVSSSGGEDFDSILGERTEKRTSLHRGSGSHQSEITRIVPLKPERSKSIACKDEQDRAGLDELRQVFRKEYRWSVGSPEGSSDLNWTEVSTFHPELAQDLDSKAEHDDQAARGPTESQPFGPKLSALPKMAPPAPPVKTQKARESVLILRNSRSVGRDPSLDAAKKRHSVTPWPLPFIGNLASHELLTDSLHCYFQ